MVAATPSDVEEPPSNAIGGATEFDPAEYDENLSAGSSAIPANTDTEVVDNRILGGRSSANIVQATVVEDLGRDSKRCQIRLKILCPKIDKSIYSDGLDMAFRRYGCCPLL